MAVPRVLFVGGAPITGKSSVARELGSLLGRVVISTDDMGLAVRNMVSPTENGALHAAAPADYSTYYAKTPVPQQLQDALAAHRALWPAIRAVADAHDVWAAPAIVEGWALLPELVVQWRPRRGVWLSVPTAVLEARVRSDVGFMAGASDPSAALKGYCGRGAQFSAHLRRAAGQFGLPFIDLDGTESPVDIAQRLASELAEV